MLGFFNLDSEALSICWVSDFTFGIREMILSDGPYENMHNHRLNLRSSDSFAGTDGIRFSTLASPVDFE